MSTPPDPPVSATSPAAPGEPRRTNADYRWTVPKVHAFLDALAQSGRVADAARAVGMSRQAAYKLRARLDGPQFRAPSQRLEVMDAGRETARMLGSGRRRHGEIRADRRLTGGRSYMQTSDRAARPSERRMRRLPHICGAALALIVSPAAAQDETAEDGQIVVEGRLETLDEAETRRIADIYVRELTVIDPQEALALYDPGTFCPGVLGMTDAINTRIAARMRRVAEAAGIRPAESDCQTSALVVFVDDKARFLEEFQQAHPVYFRSEREKVWSVPEEPGPAVAWQLSALVNENGKPVAYGGTVESYSGGSRLLSLTRTVIAMSVVIVERDALRGLNTDQIADYVLMRGLIGGDISGLAGSGAATILTVLTTPMGEATYPSLTEWDFAYLQERYSGDPRIYGDRKGAALRRAVREATEERPAAITAPDVEEEPD